MIACNSVFIVNQLHHGNQMNRLILLVAVMLPNALCCMELTDDELFAPWQPKTDVEYSAPHSPQEVMDTADTPEAGSEGSTCGTSFGPEEGVKLVKITSPKPHLCSRFETFMDLVKRQQDPILRAILDDVIPLAKRFPTADLQFLLKKFASPHFVATKMSVGCFVCFILKEAYRLSPEEYALVTNHSEKLVTMIPTTLQENDRSWRQLSTYIIDNVDHSELTNEEWDELYSYSS